MKPQIAFLGTGIVGAPMCGHLLDAAYPAAVHQALIGGFADSTILRQHGERMISRQFEPGAKAEMQLKDLRTARELAESLGLDLPVLKLTEDLYRDMCAHGRSELDHSALYLELADRCKDS